MSALIKIEISGPFGCGKEGIARKVAALLYDMFYIDPRLELELTGMEDLGPDGTPKSRSIGPKNSPFLIVVTTPKSE